MIRVLIFGATGYTGLELIRILSSHPEVIIAGGSSRQWQGQQASQALPFIRPDRDFPMVELEKLLANPQADLAFLALPHGESASLIRPLVKAGIKVIDLSADSRLHDPLVYEQWYGPHKDPAILSKVVYGLPEIHREEIRNASIVANPGCYPTTVILGLAPLVHRDDVDTSVAVVDSKSGVSGAGRGGKLGTSFCEIAESFAPYGVLNHRHIPEMEHELSQLKGQPVRVRFTPHLIPVTRGMVSTIYVPLKQDVTGETLRQACADHYRSEPFVKVLPGGTFPQTVHVRGSNMCHIAVEVDERTGWVVVMSALDNLVKGASGEAVQNMNIMMGLVETAGLTGFPLFP